MIAAPQPRVFESRPGARFVCVCTVPSYLGTLAIILESGRFYTECSFKVFLSMFYFSNTTSKTKAPYLIGGTLQRKRAIIGTIYDLQSTIHNPQSTRIGTRSNSHALFSNESEDMAEQVHCSKRKLPSPGTKKHKKSKLRRKPFGHLVHLNTNPP